MPIINGTEEGSTPSPTHLCSLHRWRLKKGDPDAPVNKDIRIR